MSNLSRIERHLRNENVLRYSGGFGTTLGLTDTLQLPLWSAAANFNGPEKLIAVHRQFVASGAQVLSTNTFRMQRNRIEAALPGGGKEITETGVRNAMQAAHIVKAENGNAPFVAGSFGPIGGTHIGKPSGYSPDDLLAMHREQARRIAQHNPDFLAPEAIPTLEEGVAMAQAASEVFQQTNGRIPFVLGVSIETADRLFCGTELRDFVRQTDLPGRVGITFNCRPAEVIDGGLKNLSRYYAGFTGGYANGPGKPAANDANWDHDTNPAAIGRFARTTADWTDIDSKVKIIGVCCGGSPQVVAAVGKELAARQERDTESQSSPAARTSRFVAEEIQDQPLAAAGCPCGAEHYTFG